MRIGVLAAHRADPARRVELPGLVSEFERLATADRHGSVHDGVRANDDPEPAILERNDDVQVLIAFGTLIRHRAGDAIRA